MSRSSPSHAVALAAVLALGLPVEKALGADAVSEGANGTTGACGVTGDPGSAGAPGTAGGGATATSTAVNSDESNNAFARGGRGGNGGCGGPGLDGPDGDNIGNGGAGGAGGTGGDAAALATKVASGPAFASADSQGGSGGSGGNGGPALGAVGTPGSRGSAGAGGNASSVAQATSTDDRAQTFVTAQGGSGGTGGSATATADSSGRDFSNATARATAGSSTFATGELADGLAGADATASASATSLESGVDVRVTAAGGVGQSARGTGRRSGDGGAAIITQASGSSGADGSVTVTVEAFGGSGGEGLEGAAGGDGADVLLNNVATGSTAGELRLVQSATAGGGGGATGGPMGRNGAATSILQVDHGGTSLSAAADARGGPLSLGSPPVAGGGDGAEGGAAEAVSEARGNGTVVATAQAIGGAGSSSIGFRPGAGGAATARAYGESRDGGHVSVAARQTGGNGGSSLSGLEGAAGMSSVMVDAVRAVTSGNAVLTQEATGGNGGAGGSGGLGGLARSLLTESFAGSDLNVFLRAIGGAGGTSTGMGGSNSAIAAGGQAVAQGDITAAGSVVTNVLAAGGAGGSGGGQGGEVEASAMVRSTGGGLVDVDLRAVGGDGGSASIFGPGMSAGGRGADVALNNDARGETAGELRLRQEARGGNGGTTGTGDGGLAGNALSILDVDQSGSGLVLNAVAAGGSGGGGGTGAMSATDGGTAEASAIGRTVSGPADVRASAQGGAGGSWSSNLPKAGTGGAARADAEATGASDDVVRASSEAIGGAGGRASDFAPAAGNGGIATATARAIGSQRVEVSAVQTGGRGGDARRGATAGDGADSWLVDAVYGHSTGLGGSVVLTQEARAGDGGNSGDFFQAGTGGGDGGRADSRLTFSSSVAPSAESDMVLAANLLAAGGRGGAGGGMGGLARTTADLTARGGLSASIQAMGGAGGQATTGEALAGDAEVAARLVSTEVGRANLILSVLGGSGGGGDGSGARGADGGLARVGPVEVTASQSASVQILAQGGNGGSGANGARAGNGAATDVTNVISLVGAGIAEVNQTVVGGRGGSTDSFADSGGRGGDARSELVGTYTGSQILAVVSAFAGQGGQNGFWQVGESGDAAAFLEVSSSGALNLTSQSSTTGSRSAVARTQAISDYSLAPVGQARMISTAAATSGRGPTGGEATADALARVTRSGVAASAVASADAESGSSAAQADASSPLVSISGVATGRFFVNSDGGGAESRATTAVGPTTDFGISDARAGNPFLKGSALEGLAAAGPIAPELLLESAEVAAAFVGQTDTLLLASTAFSSSRLDGELGLSAALEVRLAPTGTPFQELQIGLFNGTAAGEGIVDLRFQAVSDGETLLDVAFTDLLSAVAYFTDNVILLNNWDPGADGQLDATFRLDFSPSQANQRFAFNLAARGLNPVPLPGAWVLLASGLAMLGTYRRRRSY